MINNPETTEVLQALRNITREYMRLRSKVDGVLLDETRHVVCVQEALEQLDVHKFKTDRPL
jgi:hypothetical protein